MRRSRRLRRGPLPSPESVGLPARRRWLARPRWTVRLRLTLMYGGLFLASGVALLAITYFLVKQDIGNNFLTAIKSPVTAITAPVPGGKGAAAVGFASVTLGTGAGRGAVEQFVRSQMGGGSTVVRTIGGQRGSASPRDSAGNLVLQVPVPGFPRGKAPSPKQAREQLAILLSEAQAQQNGELHQLLVDSGLALLAMSALSVLLGWLLAGRALRPLRVITATAQDISSTNLHERIGLRGPDDEMKRLGDTFDALLARLEGAFDAQRQFVANASHELRTPLARQRTLLEVAAGNPDADVSSLREASVKAISAGEEQEQLIEALLTLASSERGLGDRAPFDLATVTGRVVASKQPEAALRGLDIETSLGPAPTVGDERLAERLVANLVENALRHNEDRGWVVISTSAEDGVASLRVANSGPAVPEPEIDRLFEPFQRLATARTARDGHGLGLGLSIVRAVARAHGAAVTATGRPPGGLDVCVAFPLVAAAAPGGPRDGRSTGAGSPAWGVASDRLP